VQDENSTQDAANIGDENTITEETHASSTDRPPTPAAELETKPLNEALPPVKAPKPRGSTGRFLLAAITFVIGIAAGIGATLLFLLVISGNKPLLPVATPSTSPTPGSITVQADSKVVASALQTALQDAQIPGNISNIQVQFTSGDQMTVTGDYVYKVLGVNVINPFTLELQIVVNACQLKIHILQANFANLPVTGFIALFEDRINQKLNPSSSTLPGNIEYCIVDVHTDPVTGMSVTLDVVFPTSSAAATPMSLALRSLLQLSVA